LTDHPSHDLATANLVIPLLVNCVVSSITATAPQTQKVLGKVTQVTSFQVSLFPVTWSPNTCSTDPLIIKVNASGTLTAALDATAGTLTLQVPLTPYNTPKQFITVDYTLQV